MRIRAFAVPCALTWRDPLLHEDHVERKTLPDETTPPVPDQPAHEAAAKTPRPAAQAKPKAAKTPPAAPDANAPDASDPKAPAPAAPGPDAAPESPESAAPAPAAPASAAAAPAAPASAAPAPAPAAPAPAAPAPAPAAPAPAPDIDETGAAKLGDDVTQIGRGFLGALFDVSFRTFITRRLAGLFYVVGLIGIAIGFLVYFISGIVRGVSLLVAPAAVAGHVGAGIALLLATIIVVPLVTFFAVVLLRFLIEAVVALVAIAENTERTAQHTRR
jgi:hypothetical protein